MRDGEPAWSPDGETIAYASERPGWTELHLVGRDGSGDRQLTDDGGDFSEFRWHPDGSRLVAIRGRRGRLRPRDGRRGHRRGRDARAGRGLGLARVDGGGRSSSPPTTTTRRPPELRLVGAGGTRSLLAPAPIAVKRAPYVSPEEVTYRSFDGLEIPALLFRPPGASAERPAPAVVYPHGGPTDAYGDEWDGHAQYFIAKGYAWICPNFRGSTSYGRDFERANHGVWGVDDTKDCLAAADFLRTLDWVDGEPAGDLRRELRLVHGAPLGHGRPRAPLPLRRLQVRRLRPRHVMGAGRPAGRAGPRADDGHAGRAPGGLPGRARPSTAWRT